MLGSLDPMRGRLISLLLAVGMVALSSCSDAAGGTATGSSVTSETDVSTTEPVVETTEPATTTTVPALDVYDPLCVVQVAPGESLSLIADRFDDDTVRVDTIGAENDLTQIRRDMQGLLDTPPARPASPPAAPPGIPPSPPPDGPS